MKRPAWAIGFYAVERDNQRKKLEAESRTLITNATAQTPESEVAPSIIPVAPATSVDTTRITVA